MSVWKKDGGPVFVLSMNRLLKRGKHSARTGFPSFAGGKPIFLFWPVPHTQALCLTMVKDTISDKKFLHWQDCRAVSLLPRLTVGHGNLFCPASFLRKQGENLLAVY